MGFRENEEESFSSMFGAGLSILIFIVTLLYAIKKGVILSEREDLLITEYTEKNILVEESFGFE